MVQLEGDMTPCAIEDERTSSLTKFAQAVLEVFA